MIKIDFHGSTHGNFLEYTSNVYIMQTDPGQSVLFNSVGASHAVDNTYLKNRQIKCGHYSSSNIKFNNTDQVIRITIDPLDDQQFFIALTNLMYRAGDVGIEKQMLHIPDSVRKDPVAIRNNWYSKFSERNNYGDIYKKFTKIDQSIFEFPFSAFYSFPKFCKSLNEMAAFLNQTFFPDQSLFVLWKKFIEMNQGVQSYNKCNTILENIFANCDTTIDCTVIEQGWINYNLSKICRMYNGSMFEQEQFPTNPQSIYQEIKQHLEYLQTC
jgi:hypothetical protein